MKKNQNKLPIGVFDSGVGGLTVVKELIKRLPNENIIYFGDTARVPYGTKSAKTIKHFAIQDTNFLLSKNVKIIVVACNTVSSNAMDILKRKFKVPFIDVLKPNAILAANITTNNKIGVIGTPATIESKSYNKIIINKNKKTKIYSLPTPLLVPLAEEGWINKQATHSILNEYLSVLLRKNIDTLILGCTHYPLFEKQIKKICGKNVNVINSARETANTVYNVLNKMDLLNNSTKKGDIHFYLSDIPRNFPNILIRFLDYKLKNKIKKIDIEKY